jgi:hypothetical protein
VALELILPTEYVQKEIEDERGEESEGKAKVQELNEQRIVFDP